MIKIALQYKYKFLYLKFCRAVYEKFDLNCLQFDTVWVRKRIR